MPDSKTLATLSTVEDLTTEVLHKLQGLSSQEWEAPSRCHMWAIKDVACHMVAVSGFYLNSINRSKDGDGMPPEGMPNPGAATAKDLSKGIASRAIQISETSLKTPTDIVQTLYSLEQQLIDTWKSLDEPQWNLPAYHIANRSTPQGIIYWKLLETSIHSWDIFNALDDSYNVNPEAAVLLNEVWKNREMNRWFISLHPDQMEGTIIDVELEDSLGLRIENWNGTLRITSRPANKTTATASIQVDPGLFALLITARANLETLIDKGSVSITGNREAVYLFHEWFRGS